MTINIEELKRDHEAGTGGPWRAVRDGNVYRITYNKIGNWCADVIVDGDEMAAYSDARRIARLPDLETAFLEAVELLKNAMSIVENCTIEEGICCCGDDMRRHAEPMTCGHSPVDHGAYVADQFYSASSEFLEKLK